MGAGGPSHRGSGYTIIVLVFSAKESTIEECALEAALFQILISLSLTSDKMLSQWLFVHTIFCIVY